MKHIVQVSVSGVENNSNTQSDAVCAVLTEDGEVFTCWAGSLGWSDWQKMKPLPDEKEGK